MGVVVTLSRDAVTGRQVFEGLVLDAHLDILATSPGRGLSRRAQKHFERNP